LSVVITSRTFKLQAHPGAEALGNGTDIADSGKLALVLERNKRDFLANIEVLFLLHPVIIIN
jgi:hypothetical protein